MKEIEINKDYFVDEYGNVYSNKKNKLKQLKPILTKYGYYEVHLYGEISKRCKIHRLVAEAFIPNSENKPEINHIDGNKLNNNVSNLEWCTTKENMKHARDTGLNTSIPPPNGKGIKNSRSRLTEKEVLEIRANIENKTHKELAVLYNVAPSTISGIIARLRWKHI